jgi:RND family efflux transporter MFP subunit
VGKIKSFFSKAKRVAWEHKRISIVAVVILLIIGFVVWPKGSKQILTEKVKKQDVVKLVSITGNVDAQTFVNLTFQMGGTLSYLGVKTGDSVKVYQTIATLDQRTVQKNIQIALANYAEQRNAFDATSNSYNDTPSQQATSNQMRRILEDNQYDLNKAVASVELQDLVRQQSVLTSPIAGIVTRADAVTTGVNVTPATTFTITDPGSLGFKMEVDEADIGQIKIGQAVNVSLDSFPNDNLKLTVKKIDFVNHVTSSGGNAFYVEAALPMQNNYRVGMSGNADIVIDTRNNTIAIQSSDIFDNNYVYVKTAKGFTKRKLNLGLQSDTEAQILSGLSEEDTVAIDPTSVPQNQIVKN